MADAPRSFPYYPRFYGYQAQLSFLLWLVWKHKPKTALFLQKKTRHNEKFKIRAENELILGVCFLT